MPPGPENPSPISDQNLRFSVPYFRPDFQNVYPISDPVMCGNFNNSPWIYGVRDFVAPQTMFFFFAIDVHGNTRYSKNGIPDQTDGIYTLFQTKMAKSIPYFRLEMLENGTLWGGTYLYGSYMGVAPPPPPPPRAAGVTIMACKLTRGGRGFNIEKGIHSKRYSGMFSN